MSNSLFEPGEVVTEAEWQARRMAAVEDALLRDFDAQLNPANPADGIKARIATEAVKIVNGARRGAYGTPEDNFARIARFWTAYFQNTGRDVEVTAYDVSPMMRLMKEARLCETPDHLDSHVDLVGYTLTGAEVNGVKMPLDSA